MEKDTITTSITDLLHLLSDQLYANPEVFIREIISNAYDAILKRCLVSREPLAKGRITLTGDNAGTITIEDNGIGMSETDLRDFLSCVGKSKTREFTGSKHAIGHFGLGFLSIIAVAEMITIDTLLWGSNTSEARRWVWEGGINYQIEKSARDQPGTSIKIHLKPEYREYASPQVIKTLVLKYVPFLNVEVLVPPFGNPKPALIPWKDGAMESKPIDLSYVQGLAYFKAVVEDPTHLFLLSFEDGGGMFWMPKSTSIAKRVLLVYQHGVLVTDTGTDLLSSDWDWISGIIDIGDVTITLNRNDFRRDQKFEELRKLVRRKLNDEIIRLSRSDLSLFTDLINQQRQTMASLIQNQAVLMDKVAGKYPFKTTLGELSCEIMQEYAPEQNQIREIAFMSHPPNTDLRWSTAIASKRLIVWCQNPQEEYLLRTIVERTNRTRWRELTWGGPEEETRLQWRQEAPVLSEEFRSWLKNLQFLLEPEGILVEALNFEPESEAAIVEFSEMGFKISQNSAKSDSAIRKTVTNFINLLKSAIKSASFQARLVVNPLNNQIKLLATQKKQNIPIELSASLLMTSGFVKSGMPVNTEWLQKISKLAEASLSKLLNEEYSIFAEKAPHVICFFAHEFRSDKRLLAVLRNVLEHPPFFWEVKSGEEETREPTVFSNVWRQMLASHVVIAEVTRKNPNVLLEAGIGYGLKEHHNVLLFSEEGADVLSDLKGHLLFLYKLHELEHNAEILAHKISDWINKQSHLKRLRRSLPFLGYRLLVEKKILSPGELAKLENEIGEPSFFLSESPEKIQKLTGVPIQKIVSSQRYLKERIDRFNGVIS